MNPSQLYQWVENLSKDWVGFSRHFKQNVRVFSGGVARSQSSQIRRIAGCVGGKNESQRRRLQRFVRQKLEMSTFFKNWSSSLVADLAPAKITLVVDETKLKQDFGVMVVGLAYEKRCIPLAWRIYAANQAEAYPPEGRVGIILALLQAIHEGLPPHAEVLVLADRGIGTSPELMRGIMSLGWHFLFRVTKQSKVILATGEEVTFYDQVTQPQQSYQASGIVFKRRGRIPAHVRVIWGELAREQWALVTNDPALCGWEYAQRMWVEEAFRDLKSHGWQVEAARFTCPNRLERFWILLVVAYAWMIKWGQALERAGLAPPYKRRKTEALTRQWSLFRLGLLAFLTYSTPLRL